VKAQLKLKERPWGGGVQKHTTPRRFLIFEPLTIFAFWGKYMYNYNKFQGHSAKLETDVDLNTAVLPNATAPSGGSVIGASPTI